MKRLVGILALLGILVCLVAGINSKSSELSSEPAVANISEEKQQVETIELEATLDEGLVARAWLRTAYVYGTEAVKHYGGKVVASFFNNGGGANIAEESDLEDLDIVFDN
ncbi:hypothetical protein [Providencia sp. NPDC089923]|uniref:hypothetical protein n=1 Tax=Providencia sp. NPDC089923 TaxID=3415004 RepID=UPI003C2FA0B6